MSRPWILGIVGALLFASTTTVVMGQEYLDLPDEPTDQASSLTDKFRSFTDKFRRDSGQSQQATATPRTRPTNPRYRNTARSSMQAQRARRNSANSTNAATRNVASGNPAAPAQRMQQSAKAQARNSAISKTNDLLANSKLFSRDSKPLPKPPQTESKKVVRTATQPRAGSVKSTPVVPRVARRSPSTSRSNELDAALADLLTTRPSAKPKTVAIEPLESTTSPSTDVVIPPSSNTFDLRDALLADDEDSIAAEAAAAVEAAVQAEQAESVEPQPVETQPTEPQPVDAIAQVPEPEPTKTVEVVEPIADPIVEQKPEPVVIAAPKLEPPKTAEPQLAAPIVVETPPQPQAITIAPARPSPVVSQPNLPTRVSDPFEDSSKPAFGNQQPTNNPMRPFTPATEEPKPVASIARPERQVLQTSQQPVIVSHVEGPRSILVGREATYQVTLENTSNTQASNLDVEINVPEWAELVDAMSTSGVVTRSSEGANAGALVWKLNLLAKRSSQALRLRLIPRSGRPLQLGVRWTQAAVQTQAVVEVQEPKLEIAISGPQEVRFGKPQRYRLTVRNPGTGPTEKVSLRLVPPGGDASSATTQVIGDLKAGAVKDIDLELTAREAGELLIQANANAEGGLKAETTKSVLCLKPELEVDWRGPDKKYAGTVAAYYFRVRNPGTVATEPVDMSVKLPAGAEFVSASEGFSINTATGVVSWRLAGIGVDEEQFMQLRCKIARPGLNDFEVSAKTADNELSDSSAFQTDVVALADLKLEVTDPQGPLPLGESVVYEIRVRNRGTTNAENINIVGLFSEGIDPTTVEGAQYTVRDGRVSFHPIKSLPAGREVLLKIHAQASQVGTHIFRTEVTCPTLDIKLAAEETTRFFEDEHRWEEGQTPYTADRQSSTSR